MNMNPQALRANGLKQSDDKTEDDWFELASELEVKYGAALSEAEHERWMRKEMETRHGEVVAENAKLRADIFLLKTHLKRADEECAELLDERDVAEGAASDLAASVLGEAADWPNPQDAWRRADEVATDARNELYMHRNHPLLPQFEALRKRVCELAEDEHRLDMLAELGCDVWETAGYFEVASNPDDPSDKKIIGHGSQLRTAIDMAIDTVERMARTSLGLPEGGEL